MQDDVDETARLLRRGVARLGRRMRAERVDRGVSLTRLSVLGLLYRRGPMTPTEIAAAERIQPQSLSRVLAGLEEHQMITRERDAEDGRQFVIDLAPAGRGVIAEEAERREAWLARAMTELLTPAERGVLRIAAELMERMADD